MYAGGILPRLLAFSPREKAAYMPVPEGRMRGIREKLAPLAIPGGLYSASKDAGGPSCGPPPSLAACNLPRTMSVQGYFNPAICQILFMDSAVAATASSGGSWRTRSENGSAITGPV